MRHQSRWSAGTFHRRLRPTRLQRTMYMIEYDAALSIVTQQHSPKLVTPFSHFPFGHRVLCHLLADQDGGT